MTEIYIEQTLQSLHVSKRYKGRRQLKASVRLALEAESRLENMDKGIFARAAEETGGTAKTVARNIRTISQLLWTFYPETLQQVAGTSLNSPPTPSQLVELILTYIQRTWPETRL